MNYYAVVFLLRPTDLLRCERFELRGKISVIPQKWCPHMVRRDSKSLHARRTEDQVEIAATELKENEPDEKKDVGPVADPEHVEPETPGKDDVQMKEQPCQPQDGTDGQSTVARHEALCGTPEEALRRYIVNFARRGGSSGGGMVWELKNHAAVTVPCWC